MKKNIMCGFLLLVLALVPNTLFAYTAIHAEDTVRVDNAINDNAYIAGGKVEITGNISGDLFLAGWELLVNGNIGDNASIAGGNIETNGSFGHDAVLAWGNVLVRWVTHGDLKLAGWSIILENSASGDVNIGGGSIRIIKSVQIGKDLGVAGDTLILNGTVKGKADIFVETLNFDGVIEKDANIHINNASSLYIGPNAKILGKLTYSSPESIPALEKIASGWATYNPVSKYETGKAKADVFLGFLSVYVVYRLLFLLVAGSLLLALFPKLIAKTAEVVRSSPGKSFLFGVMYFLLMPIAIVLLFVSVLGIPVAFLALAVYIFSFVFAKLITLVVFSNLINTKWATVFNTSWKRWGIFIILAVIISLVSGIDFIVALFAFWALLLQITFVSAENKK